MRKADVAVIIDPQILLPRETHVVTASDYFRTPATHTRNRLQGRPPSGAFLKLARHRYELLPAEGLNDEDLPVKPWYLGFWTGDGVHNEPIVSSTDLGETRAALQRYVDGL